MAWCIWQTWCHVRWAWTILQCEVRQENQYLHEDTAHLNNKAPTEMTGELHTFCTFTVINHLIITLAIKADPLTLNHKITQLHFHLD